MRQSSPLLVPRLSPRTPGLCRLRSAPAGRRTFPTLLCASFPACLDPYPGSSYGARARFFPYDIDLPPVRTGSALRNVPYSDFRTALDFGAAVIPSCSGPQVCSPPRSLLPLRQHRRAAVTYYVRASRRSLPPHAPDMLAVRIGQLTAGDFHPIRCAALSAAPLTPMHEPRAACCASDYSRRGDRSPVAVSKSGRPPARSPMVLFPRPPSERLVSLSLSSCSPVTLFRASLERWSVLLWRSASRVPHRPGLSGHLDHFPLGTALPCALLGRHSHEDSWSSVTLGFAPPRRSRVPSPRNVSSAT